MWEATLWIACLAAIVLIIEPAIHEKSKLASIAAHLLLALPFFAFSQPIFGERYLLAIRRSIWW